MAGGLPIGSGIVFTSNSLQALSFANVFSKCTLGQYFTFKAEKAGQALAEYEPVGYFNFTENETNITIQLDYIREAKYIMVK